MMRPYVRATLDIDPDSGSPVHRVLARFQVFKHGETNSPMAWAAYYSRSDENHAYHYLIGHAASWEDAMFQVNRMLRSTQICVVHVDKDGNPL